MPTLVLLRHGQSQWNLENRFTGWWDVDLSVAGVEEARLAGSLLQDEGFDRSQNLHSIPAALGKSKALRVSELLHLLSAGCVIAAGIHAHFGWLYWIGTLLFAGMLIYQHSIVKPTDLSKVNIAFMTANGIASVIFSAFVLLDIFLNK